MLLLLTGVRAAATRLLMQVTRQEDSEAILGLVVKAKQKQRLKLRQKPKEKAAVKVRVKERVKVRVKVRENDETRIRDVWERRC